MMLCEVALGEMYEPKTVEFVTELKAPFKSTKAPGS